MKNTIYLLLLLLIWNPALSWGYFEIPQGMYESSSSSSPESSSEPYVADDTPSEVKRSEEPVLQTASTSSAKAKLTAKTEPETPAAAPAKGGSFFNPSYKMPSTGTKGHKGEKLVNLKSCDQIKMITGEKPRSGKEGSCGEVKIAASFVPTLMSQLPICIQEGAKASGKNMPIQKTNIYNAGAFNEKKTKSNGKWSLHSTGRAFDIYQIDVIFNDGSSLKTPMTIKSKKNPFYTSFNKCWSSFMKKKMAAQKSSCGWMDGHIGSEDRYHQQSIHLSLPYCPRLAGYSSI